MHARTDAVTRRQRKAKQSDFRAGSERRLIFPAERPQALNNPAKPGLYEKKDRSWSTYRADEFAFFFARTHEAGKQRY
jgi:hypothetical protein